jgi:hypothetical protein
MAKYGKTVGFRTTQAEAKALTAATKATNMKASDIVRRCVALALSNVVDESRKAHDAAIVEFEQVLREVGPPYGGKPKKVDSG